MRLSSANAPQENEKLAQTRTRICLYLKVSPTSDSSDVNYNADSFLAIYRTLCDLIMKATPDAAMQQFE